jgi:hypothetical protein
MPKRPRGLDQAPPFAALLPLGRLRRRCGSRMLVFPEPTSAANLRKTGTIQRVSRNARPETANESVRSLSCSADRPAANRIPRPRPAVQGGAMRAARALGRGVVHRRMAGDFP